MLSALPGRIPWRRAWQATPVFLPGEPLGQRNPVRLHTAHRIAKSWTQLRRQHTCTCTAWHPVSAEDMEETIVSRSFFLLQCPAQHQSQPTVSACLWSWTSGICWNTRDTTLTCLYISALTLILYDSRQANFCLYTLVCVQPVNLLTRPFGRWKSWGSWLVGNA